MAQWNEEDQERDRCVVSADADGNIRVWQLSTRALVNEFRVVSDPQGVLDMHFRVDGSLLMHTRGGGLLLVDPMAAERNAVIEAEVLFPHTGFCRSLLLTDSTIVAPTEKGFVVLSLPDFTELASFDSEKGGTPMSLAVAHSADSFVVVLGQENGDIRVFRIKLTDQNSQVEERKSQNAVDIEVIELSTRSVGTEPILSVEIKCIDDKLHVFAASASRDLRALVFHMDSQVWNERQKRELPAMGVNRVLFLRNNDRDDNRVPARILVLSWSGDVLVLSSRSLKTRAISKQDQGVQDMAQDGDTLVAGGKNTLVSVWPVSDLLAV